MRLTELVTDVPGATLHGGGGDPEIASASYDSRSATPGSIFVAVAGFKADRHDHLKQALAAGAFAVAPSVPLKQKWSSFLGATPAPPPLVPDTRHAPPRISAAMRRDPARPLRA